jgi:hypothetical protein
MVASRPRRRRARQPRRAAQFSSVPGPSAPEPTLRLACLLLAAAAALAMLDGVWRGPATVSEADGRRIGFVQTERIGAFLGGSIKVIEGRGYGDDGAVRFNGSSTCD